jgi:hypothetical protein
MALQQQEFFYTAPLGPKKLQFLSIFFENFEKIKLINLGYVR